MAAPPTVQGLLRAGILTGYQTVATAEGGRRTIAVAPDPARAKSLLQEHAGPSVSVIGGRVSMREYTELASVLSESKEELVAALGRGYGADHQPVVTASIKYVSATLANRLQPFARDAAQFELLLRPANSA
jgi:hypothetical protein